MTYVEKTARLKKCHYNSVKWYTHVWQREQRIGYVVQKNMSDPLLTGSYAFSHNMCSRFNYLIIPHKTPPIIFIRPP